MAILALMAARGWSKAEAGRRFLVTDDTVASWSGRIEQDEPGALVKTTVPVNKFPDFVAAMVIKLKTLFPMMGRRRIAGFLVPRQHAIRRAGAGISRWDGTLSGTISGARSLCAGRDQVRIGVDGRLRADVRRRHGTGTRGRREWFVQAARRS
jgi:hypothetical protein